jgi:hypothetical protein
MSHTQEGLKNTGSSVEGCMNGVCKVRCLSKVPLVCPEV